MSCMSLRFAGTAAAAAGLLLLVPVVVAAPAGATGRPAPRSTCAMLFGELVAESAQIGADLDGVDGRSIHTMRAAAAELTADARRDFGRLPQLRIWAGSAALLLASVRHA